MGCALAVLVGAGRWVSAEDVTFRREVMVVLSKAGCNQGTCHGNFNGKNGFRLSLRGQDPAFDFNSLLRDQFSRRLNFEQPDESLLLLKAVAAVPHGGGRRFRPDSPEYEILRQWIADGAKDVRDLPKLVKVEVSPREQFLVAPEHSVQLKVTATFADDTTRDVTRWALYTASNPIAEITVDGLVERARDGETTVIARYLDRQSTVRLAFVPERADFRWSDPKPNNFVDEHVLARLKKLRMNPSPTCSDTVFVRRAYLDLLGILPTADEARAFVADKAADKRAKLIDALLERDEYAECWSLKWADLLRVEERALDRKGVQVFARWLRDAAAEDRPLDEFAHTLLAARGSTYQNPPTNFYRAMRDPITRAESVGQVFLGVRLQCAKCHNHPFDRWTQDDYYRWASVFAGVDYKILENKRRDRNDKHEFIGEQWVVDAAAIADLKNPSTDERAAPRFLGAKVGPENGDDRLTSMADWVSSRDNPYFAKVQANRIWFHLMGRGLVDPIDDFRATNPPSHPGLLDALAHEFVAGGYRTKPIIRLVVNSQAYQASAIPNATNADDEASYSHTVLRPLSAEQLLDALHQVTGTQAAFVGYPVGLRAGELPGVSAVRSRDGGAGPEEKFLTQFGKPPRLLSCDCERTRESTLGRTFQLVSGATLNDLLRQRDNRIFELAGSKRTDAEVIDELFWTALSRAPTSEEATKFADYMKKADDRRRALEDIAWSLLNAKEFLLRQ